MPGDVETRKRAVNVSLDMAVVADARALGLNIAGILDEALKREVTVEKARRWREDNAAAIAMNNTRIEDDGLWCDDHRLF